MQKLVALLVDDLGSSYVKVDIIKMSLRKIEDKPRELMKDQNK